MIFQELNCDNINVQRKFGTPGNFGYPKAGTYHFQNFRYETLKSPLMKKLSVSLLPHAFGVKVTND